MAIAVIATVVIFSHTQTNAITVDSRFLNLDTNCPIGNDSSFTGMLSIQPDTYAVYARLPTSGQTADVRAFAQSSQDGAKCAQIGAVKATGDKWSLVGTLKATAVDTQTILQLASKTLNSTLGANRPSIMLVSQTHPTCVPTTECFVTIDGQQGYVRPIGTLPNEDSLHIVIPLEPSQDTIKDVTYYVDKEPAYTTKTLEPFDMRYVTYPNQVLARVIEYQSGQRIVLNQTIPADFTDNFWNFLFRLTQTNPTAFVIIGSIIGVLIAGRISLVIIRSIERRRIWRLDHGLEVEQVQIVTDADRRRAFMREHQEILIKRIVLGVVGVVGIVTLVIATNSFVTQLYKVDGHSMESTYMNGSQLFINKLPITWAHIAGHDYAPSRGQVVIVRQIFGITDDVQSADKTNDYLIKRVIGLPGERVVVHNGVITITNPDNPNGFNPDLTGKWRSTMHADTEEGDVDVTLGKDEIFICGDNRPESIDSRFNGPILTKQIVGLVGDPS